VYNYTVSRELNLAINFDKNFAEVNFMAGDNILYFVAYANNQNYIILLQ
jgi:hypothetical protein